MLSYEMISKDALVTFIQPLIIQEIYSSIMINNNKRWLLMPLTHEFGIIKDITEKSYKNYAPEKSQCISIDDEIITNLMKPLSLLKTYFHSLNRPEYGLAYHGITIIPPESLPTFLDIVLSADDLKQFEDLNELGQEIMQAKNENKYMIHYGI